MAEAVKNLEMNADLLRQWETEWVEGHELRLLAKATKRRTRRNYIVYERRTEVDPIHWTENL